MRCPLGGSEPRNRKGRSRCFVQCPYIAETATGATAATSRNGGFRAIYRGPWEYCFREIERGEREMREGRFGWWSWLIGELAGASGGGVERSRRLGFHLERIKGFEPFGSWEEEK
ncbi:hypothetical protein GQ457_08G015120 [Hibiscus cannabinus]